MQSIARFLAETRAALESRLLSFVLRRSGRDAQRQERVLQRLLRGFSQADYGRARRLSPGMAYERFRSCAPLQSHASLLPLFRQVLQGTPDVFWPGRPGLFASSNILPGEEARCLPVTPELLHHLQEAWHRAMLLLLPKGNPALVLGAPAIWPGSGSASGEAPAQPDQPSVLRLWELLEYALRTEGAG